MNESCPFCRIVTGDEEAYVVAETEETVAFLDDNPAIEGHTLVVPRSHDATLSAMDEETTAAVFAAARRVAVAAEDALDADGVSLFHSSGAAAGQDVFHAHVHVLPRFEDDAISFSPGRGTLTRDDAEALTTRISDAL